MDALQTAQEAVKRCQQQCIDTSSGVHIVHERRVLSLAASLETAVQVLVKSGTVASTPRSTSAQEALKSEEREEPPSAFIEAETKGPFKGLPITTASASSPVGQSRAETNQVHQNRGDRYRRQPTFHTTTRKRQRVLQGD